MLDYILHAPSQETLLAALETAALYDTKTGYVLDSPSLILNPVGPVTTPATLDEAGHEVTPPLVHPGWYVLLRLLEGELPPSLRPFVVQPDAAVPLPAWYEAPIDNPNPEPIYLPTTMQLLLNTPEKLRTNWPFLTADQIKTLLDEGTVDIAFIATTNQEVKGRHYAGMAALRSFYRAGGEEIAPCTDFVQLPLKPETAYQVAGLIMQQEPGVLAALIQANGGTMPPFLPPTNAADAAK